MEFPFYAGKLRKTVERTNIFQSTSPLLIVLFSSFDINFPVTLFISHIDFRFSTNPICKHPMDQSISPLLTVIFSFLDRIFPLNTLIISIDFPYSSHKAST